MRPFTAFDDLYQVAAREFPVHEEDVTSFYVGFELGSFGGPRREGVFNGVCFGFTHN